MSNAESAGMESVIVETEVHFSLHELGRASGVEVTLLQTLVHEGVLAPQGGDPAQWRFEGSSLPRARKAVRLIHDLELSAPGVALVLDLFDEIETLRSQLRRLPR